MAGNEYRKGRLTGETVSWYTPTPTQSNACCLYCGWRVNRPGDVPSDKEHLIARQFVPSGTLDRQPFNFIFRACRTCNARKGVAERHVSSVTLFNSPSRSIDPRAEHAADRKGKADFHPLKKGVLIQDSHQEMKMNGKLGPMSISFGMVAPPQLDKNAAGELAFSHIQGLFALITTGDYRDPSQMRLLPQDEFVWYDLYPYNDWGNPQAVELARRVEDWECLANITSADGYFRATMRRKGEWFWALEWNKQLRLVGGIAKGRMKLFEGLPGERWIPAPQGRMRREVPLDAATDILFAGVVSHS